MIRYPFAAFIIVVLPMMLLIGAFAEPDRKFREIAAEVWGNYCELWRSP